MSEATCQSTSCKTVFKTFYLCVWMDSTHFLHIVEEQCKMRIGYFQHYWWDMQASTLILMVLALPALVLIKGLLVSDEFKDRFFLGGGGVWGVDSKFLYSSKTGEFNLKSCSCTMFLHTKFLQWPNILVKLPHPDLGSGHSSPPFVLSLSSLTAVCLWGLFSFCGLF